MMKFGVSFQVGSAGLGSNQEFGGLGVLSGSIHASNSKSSA